MKLLEFTALAATRALAEEELSAFNQGLRGMERALGIRYTRIDPHGVTAVLAVAEQHLQPAGLVNGGVFAAMGESVGSTAGLVAAGGTPVVGVNNNTDFISSVREGLIEAIAEPIQLGSRTQIWLITMMQGNRLVARTNLRTMLLS